MNQNHFKHHSRKCCNLTFRGALVPCAEVGLFIRSARICSLKSVGVFFISSENGVHVWIGFGNSKQILLQLKRCNEFFLRHYNTVNVEKCIIALWSSNHTSMCIFRSHNNFNWFFFSTGETMKKYGIVATSFLICMIFIGIIVFIIR